MVSLIFDDLPRYEHLNPWLASLLVLPEHRRKDVGVHLVREAEQRLLLNGIPRAYLFTESSRAFFEKLGWIFVESGACNHHRLSFSQRSSRATNRQHRS
jgi:N-acetylglutamate synthase-like GNAT family acetyltransferase